MSPRKKKESALRSRTQEKLDKSLQEAATCNKSKPKPQPQPKVKSGLGRNPESDEHLLQSLESKRKKLKEKKAYTALITINELDFLLELARE